MSRSTHYAEWHEYNIWVNVKISLEKKGSRSTMCPITLNTKQRLTCLCDINIQVLVNSSHDCQEKRIATFSTEDLLQVFWMFYAVAEKKKKWSRFRKKSIINQACIFRVLLKKPNLTHPSCSDLYFTLTCEGILKGGISGWFTITFSWWIDLGKKCMYKVSFVLKMCGFSECFPSSLHISFLLYIVVTLYSAFVLFCLFCHLTWHITLH